MGIGRTVFGMDCCCTGTAPVTYCCEMCPPTGFGSGTAGLPYAKSPDTSCYYPPLCFVWEDSLVGTTWYILNPITSHTPPLVAELLPNGCADDGFSGNGCWYGGQRGGPSKDKNQIIYLCCDYTNHLICAIYVRKVGGTFESINIGSFTSWSCHPFFATTTYTIGDETVTLTASQDMSGCTLLGEMAGTDEDLSILNIVRTGNLRHFDCIHLGEETGDAQQCLSCAGNVKIKLRSCKVYGKCSTFKLLPGVAYCQNCEDYQREGELKPMRWSYGVTTVPARKDDLLPKTLESLRNGGFPEPRLFVDGCVPALAAGYERQFGLPVTGRFPPVRTALNWWLALQELYTREPHAQRYALFQDDILVARNLRQFLERSPYPEKGYLNCSCYPENEKYIPKDEQGKPKTGWHLVAEVGKGWAGFGAQALVFSRDAVLQVLGSEYMLKRFQAQDGWARVDGGLVSAMAVIGWREWVHYPSLVYHTGKQSVMGHPPQSEFRSFPGADFDLLTLLPPQTAPKSVQLK